MAGRLGPVWAALTVLLAAGCATMPDSGDPERVNPPQGAGADQGVQVRVIPVPPRDGQSPREVVQNFLDASIADEHDYKTARQYLTPDAAGGWQPASGVVVLHDTNPGEAATDADTTRAEISIKSQETGRLDAKHSFTPMLDQPYGTTFTLVNEAKDSKGGESKAQWRIAGLPDGLIVNETNFHNTFQPVDRYFFTNTDPSRPASSAAVQQPSEALVPDPIYLRRRTDLVTAAAAALAQGPSDWLAPAVRSAFMGTRMIGVIGADDPRNPRIQFDGVDFVTSDRQCRQMAAQLYFTLLSQGGSGSVDKVALVGRFGGCELTSAQAKALSYAPGGLAGSPNGGAGGSQAYVRRADNGQLLRMLGQDSVEPVAGALGTVPLPPAVAPTGGHPVEPFAVRRDGKAAAVVGDGGRSLYVVGLGDGDKLGAPVAVSTAAHPEQGQGLTSPSWDGFGGLWAVDRDPSGPKVLLIRGQTRVVASVDLPSGRTVEGIRLSSDGARAALLLRDGTGATSLWLGLVVHGGTPDAPTAAITGVRAIAPQLSDVSSVSWADTDLLLALGRESDGVPQLHYLATDGYQGTDSELQAVDGMTVVAASEYPADPVLADSNDQEHTLYSLGGSGYSLSGGAQWQWKSYGKGGVLPAYPG